MTCLISVPWPLSLQPFWPLAVAAVPEPACATLPAATAASASAITTAPAIFRRLLISPSSSMTTGPYDFRIEDGSRKEVEAVTGRKTARARAWRPGREALGPDEAHALVHLFERRG